MYKLVQFPIIAVCARPAFIFISYIYLGGKEEVYDHS